MTRVLFLTLLIAGCAESSDLAVRGDAAIASLCAAWCGACDSPVPPAFGDCINACLPELGQDGCSSLFLGFQYACESRAIVCDEGNDCVCDPEGQCVSEERTTEYALCSEFDMACEQDDLCLDGAGFDMQSPACRDCLRRGQVDDYRACRGNCGAECDGDGLGTQACDACMAECREAL